MSSYPENFDHMLAAWNEMDLSKVRGHLEKAVAPDVHFLDPKKDVTGIDAFVEMIHEFRTEIAPDGVNSRASGIDSHNGLHRYNWAIHRQGELVLTGFDMCMMNDDGMISAVYGFFGPLPELEA